MLERADRQYLLAVGYRLHVGPCPMLGHLDPQSVTVVGAIAHQDLTRAQPARMLTAERPVWR